MNIRPNIKQIKRIPIVLLALIVFYFLMSLFYCYTTIGEVKTVKVNLHYGTEKTFKRIDVKENYFVTGLEGYLYWKVKNMKEALLLNLADRNAFINFYDLLYFLILDLAVYWMVRNLKEDTMFSTKTLDGLKIVGYIILLYPVMELLNNKITQWGIEKLTDKHFSYPWGSFSMIKFILMAFLIQLVPLFIKKGKSLQEENSLTI